MIPPSLGADGRDSRRTAIPSASSSQATPEYSLEDGRQPDDPPPLARRCRAEHRYGVPRRRGRRRGARSRGRRRPSGSSCSRTASSRAASARATRSGSSRGRRSSGRSSTSRSRTSARSGSAIYANSSPQDVQYVLAHSEAVGVLCEDEAQRAKVELGRDELPALREVLTYADLPALEDEGRAYREAHPTALDDAVAAIDEEDLFTFIYTSGTTGPPKGCMIRHRNYYAMVAVNDKLPDHGVAERRAAPLPPARPQLRAAGAPLRAVRRLHDRVPPRAARGRASDAAGAADDPAERPAHLREGAHGGHVDVRRGDRARGAGWSTGRSASAAGRASSRQQGKPVPRGLGRPGRARRPARLLEGQGAARRPAPDPDLGRRAAREGGRRVLRRDGHPHPRGLRAHGVHDRRDDEHERAIPVRHRRPGPARVRAAPRRGRRAHDPQRDDLRRVLQGSRGDGGGARATTAGSTRATSRRSTRTASSRSPTARRTSSSPRAGRTSRRRTSRTTSRRRGSSHRRSSSATGGRTRRR